MQSPVSDIFLLGILSDSHDNAESLSAAVKLLHQRGAQFLIHCGDVCDPQMLDLLAPLPAAFVWGNNDDRRALQSHAHAQGLTCHGEVGDLTLAGKRIAFLHGDNAARKQQLLAGQQYDYIFEGHTHVAADRRFGRTRLINPGALHRARPRTCALLELSADVLEFLTIR